jgi:tetratricopeptide (TPR) repeat protein
MFATSILQGIAAPAKASAHRPTTRSGSFSGPARPMGILLLVCACTSVFAADTNKNLTSPPSDLGNFAARANKIFLEARARYLADTNNATNALDFGRACFDLGELTTNNAAKAGIAELGIAACRQSIARDPKSAPAHCYLGMTIGRLADTKRNLTALKMVKEVEREFNTARELDEHFDFAAPDRNLGLLYLQAPAFISIGSRIKARQHLSRAVELAPDYPENRLNLIEALLKWGGHADAGKEFKALEKLWRGAKEKLSGDDWAASWLDWEKRFAAAKKKIADNAD